MIAGNINKTSMKQNNNSSMRQWDTLPTKSICFKMHSLKYHFWEI